MFLNQREWWKTSRLSWTWGDTWSRERHGSSGRSEAAVCCHCHSGSLHYWQAPLSGWSFHWRLITPFRAFMPPIKMKKRVNRLVILIDANQPASVAVSPHIFTCKSTDSSKLLSLWLEEILQWIVLVFGAICSSVASFPTCAACSGLFALVLLLWFDGKHSSFSVVCVCFDESSTSWCTMTAWRYLYCRTACLYMYQRRRFCFITAGQTGGIG